MDRWMMAARQASCVAIGPRAILIEGPSGIGKSSLALSLIDRGASLIGDDGVLLEARAGKLFAAPHPNTKGLIEVRNLGLIGMPVCEQARVCLLIELNREAPRFVEAAGKKQIGGITLPFLSLWPDGDTLAIKAELALERFGLAPC